ncbi:alpha-N-acetylglucosaminidase [Trametes versicolor FP-101664 SS1]|uniref:alpha-N-acetylglucosaminidase n=1 Tax=Trametes versicolor (strain FP-101664) TaxID=717944 RepID=UPI00046242E9|nr:alpha-N-acetylglucosaminidase [Trametes versicolor FP-101664 SS1]EIW60032.1 alpha-N-acetylglucosaminidase [Trametes versicolor FP-101664 SS1]
MLLRKGFCALLALGFGAAAASQDLDGIYALAKRRAPAHAHEFTFALFEGEADAFEISDAHSGIHIQCTTVSACARGFYTYLTQYGGVDIWWTGSRLNQLPSRLPKVGKTVKGQAIVSYRYHFNTVTFDYTAAFWDFEQWELELDWLALRGVNLPLAWVGYEYILIETFREAGLSDADISDFLSGPAFQAWNRFGNIQGSWGGELPTAWVDDQFALQKRLLPRMVELGMTPVMPSFTGFVPRALAALHPNASIVTGSQWSGFPTSLTNDSFLEPFDPLFATLQQSFIAKQQAAYGADISHVYTLDQYNENDPFSGDLDYLRNVSAGTFASLRAADPAAVWLMQGWLFFSDAVFWTDDRVAAYLGGVPGNDSMIVLDLYSEAQPQWNRTASYSGKQWVWCELHDYGGNIGMEGNLDVLTHAPLTALSSPGSSMKGVGLTMEGQEGNEIVYGVLLDQAWSATSLNTSSYVSSWVSRRYPVKPLPKAAQDAWRILSTTVYNNQDPNTQATIKGIYELAPALTGMTNRIGHHPTSIPYDTDATMLSALKLLLEARAQHPTLSAVPEFVYDVVDVARQLLSNRFIGLYDTLIQTYNSTSSTAQSVSAAGQPLLALLTDLDALLSTNEHFLLSSWIADARKWADGSASYGAYLEYNARNQVTLWGPDGEINDYASKAWAGLVGTYYKPRWAAFVDYLAETKGTGQAYNATAVKSTMLAIGQEWGNRTWGTGPGERWGVHGNTWEAVGNILRTWA